MDQEPEREASEAEAVRLYLEAVEVEPVSWSAIEARAQRLRVRPAWRGYAVALAGAAAAAALLVALAGHALAPVRGFHADAVQAYGAVQKATNGGSSLSDSNGQAATAAPTHSASAAALSAAPVRWHGCTYAVQAASLAPDAVRRRLSGHPPRRALWQPSPAVPRTGEPFRVLALYAVKGQSTSAEIAVLGRFGSGRPALWAARPSPASRPGCTPHGSHA